MCIYAQLTEKTGRVGLVFGRGPDEPFAPVTVNRRAQRAWKRAGLSPIGLHECRHTFASFMIAAGVNAKALSVYMGHASVTITFDLYGHRCRGNEQEAARLLDAYPAAFDEAGGVSSLSRSVPRSACAAIGSGSPKRVRSHFARSLETGVRHHRTAGSNPPPSLRRPARVSHRRARNSSFWTDWRVPRRWSVHHPRRHGRIS
jgi:hypothetical protein